MEISQHRIHGVRFLDLWAWYSLLSPHKLYIIGKMMMMTLRPIWFRNPKGTRDVILFLLLFIMSLLNLNIIVDNNNDSTLTYVNFLFC